MTLPGRHPDSPLPYSGQELDRRAHLGQPFSKPGYGSDQGGGRQYRFNALGFRGPEFDPRARYRIFAFGESHAFGYFVEAEQSWPWRFTTLWAEAMAIEPGEVCFQSFADVGASSASIARALISQCSAVRPDLVLLHFSDHRRGDVFLDGQPHRIGPWLLEEATAQAAPPDGPLRAAYLSQIGRARHFYQYALGTDPLGQESFSLATDATCLDDTLRNILLAQLFCQARGIPALATCDLVESLFNDQVRANPSLAPLLAQIDPGFLTQLRIWSVDGDCSDDPGHAGPLRHDRFARAMLRIHLESTQRHEPRVSSPSHPETAGHHPHPSPDDPVRSFYDALPFNHWGSAEQAARSIREHGALDAWPDLQGLLARPEIGSAVDCGCGAGWLASTLALHHGLMVTGIDFSPRALERARQVATQLGVAERIRFLEQDLLTLDLGERFDLVISLGALHHTTDPHAAFERVRRLARPGGHVYLGLYHEPGRRAFLEHFRQLLASRGVETAFESFARLASDLRSDEEHLRSWFRDQVLHPRESQHSLRQVSTWLADAGYRLHSTSINRFQPFDRVEELFALEEGYAEHGARALAEGRFFPGFFTVLAQRID